MRAGKLVYVKLESVSESCAVGLVYNLFLNIPCNETVSGMQHLSGEGGIHLPYVFFPAILNQVLVCLVV